MRRVFCDRCKKEIDEKNDRRTQLTLVSDTGAGVRMISDVCNGCTDAVIEFIQRKQEINHA